MLKLLDEQVEIRLTKSGGTTAVLSKWLTCPNQQVCTDFHNSAREKDSHSFPTDSHRAHPPWAEDQTQSQDVSWMFPAQHTGSEWLLWGAGKTWGADKTWWVSLPSRHMPLSWCIGVIMKSEQWSLKGTPATRPSQGEEWARVARHRGHTHSQ